MPGAVDELRSLRQAIALRRIVVGVFDRLVPALTMSVTRAAVYRWAGCRLARSVAIAGPIRIYGPPAVRYRNLVVGSGTYIGQDCTFITDAPLTIGTLVGISPQAVIMTSTHRMGSSEQRFDRTVRTAPVHIGSGAWVASLAVILPGVTIGDGAVVAAGAVVTRDVPPNVLVAGNPARVIRQLDEGESRTDADQLSAR